GGVVAGIPLPATAWAVARAPGHAGHAAFSGQQRGGGRVAARAVSPAGRSDGAIAARRAVKRALTGPARETGGATRGGYPGGHALLDGEDSNTRGVEPALAS